MSQPYDTPPDHGKRQRPPTRTFSAIGLALGGAVLVFFLDHTAPVVAQPVTVTQDIPRTPDGKPDFSGIWESMSGADYDLEPHGGRSDAPPGAGVVVGGRIPYLPEALAQRKKNFEERATADFTRLNCYSLGVPRSVYFPAPFQILQRPRDVTIVGQYGAVRTIHTNGTKHVVGPIGFWQGDSRGHWEGDTLVVSVQDFTDETWLDRSGNFHSEALHVTERWSFIDANTINYEATLEDPNVFSEPWTLQVVLYRHREPNFQLIENYCYTHEYDDYYPFPKERQPQ